MGGVLTHGCRIAHLQIVEQNVVHPWEKRDNLHCNQYFRSLSKFQTPGRSAPCRCRAMSLNVIGSRSM